MPAASMRRPGKHRASRSVTRRSHASGPAAAATRVAIWRLLHLTDLISRINPTDICFSGKTPRWTWRDGAGYRTDGPPGWSWPSGRATATAAASGPFVRWIRFDDDRSEEHTSELQSLRH